MQSRLLLPLYGLDCRCFQWRRLLKRISQRHFRYCCCDSSVGLAIDPLAVILILISNDRSSCKEGGLNRRKCILMWFCAAIISYSVFNQEMKVSVFPVAVLCSSLLCGKGKKSGDENIPSLLPLLRQRADLSRVLLQELMSCK